MSTKKEYRKALLFDQLNQQDFLSINDIMELLDVNRQSAYSYLKHLEESGCKIKKMSRNNHTYYFLESKFDNLAYQDITKDVIRKFLIIQQLQRAPLSIKELRNKFRLGSSTISCDPNDSKINLQIVRNTFDKTIDSLIENNDIILDTETNKLFPTGQNIPHCIALNDSEIWALFESLDGLAPNHPYYNQLHSIYEKCGYLIGELEYDNESLSMYIIYGKKYNQFATVKDSLTALYSHPYRDKVLKITYKTNPGLICTKHFATGLVVYSVEKDKLYLIGKQLDESQLIAGTEAPDENMATDTIILFSNVINIENTNFKNDYFHTSYYIELLKTMFSISTEHPVQVKVEFERIFNIEAKIKQLHSQRDKSTITFENGKLIYTDFISGLNDFANYIRQFGKSVTVIEPSELKDKLAFSIDRTLQRYKEVLTDE